MYDLDDLPLSNLVGLTIESITGLDQYSLEVFINTNCGKKFIFHHEQDCCEQVSLEDFEADSECFEGAVILSAEAVTKDAADQVEFPDAELDSALYTFYKIETTRGGLWMRWCGMSNGYYSEAVNFSIID
jgi:hypothetical protein